MIFPNSLIAIETKYLCISIDRMEDSEENLKIWFHTKSKISNKFTPRKHRDLVHLQTEYIYIYIYIPNTHRVYPSDSLPIHKLTALSSIFHYHRPIFTTTYPPADAYTLSI